jgi:uncharacterized protein
VFLSEADLRRAAKFVGMTPSQFETKYVYRTRNRLRFRTPRGRRCPFLEAAGCAIHPAKPAQCRLFPYWPELLESTREWRAAARYCPGMSTGPLVKIEQASAQAEEMRIEYPSLY